MMRSKQRICGQSTAEYAVLFAIVIGAAIAMQQYVKSRLQGAMESATNAYSTAVAGNGSGLDAQPFEPDRKTTSQSESDVDMTSATAGSVKAASDSETTVTKEGGAGSDPEGPGPGPGI